MGDGDNRRSSRLTWATVITTLCAGLASTNGSSEAAAAIIPPNSEIPSIDERVRAVRETLAARIADVQPKDERPQELAQWYNFPSFPNYWNQFWRNW